MNKVKRVIMSLAVVFGLGLVALPDSVGAVNALDDACSKDINKDTLVCAKKTDDSSAIVSVVVNTLLFIVGITAVVMIIIGGITYTTSGGSEEAIKRAKSMITYSVVGLVIALAAYAIVNFVVDRFK